MDEHVTLLLEALRRYPNMRDLSPKQQAGKLAAFRGRQPKQHQWVGIIKQAAEDGQVMIQDLRVWLADDDEKGEHSMPTPGGPQ